MATVVNHIKPYRGDRRPLFCAKSRNGRGGYRRIAVTEMETK